MSKKRKQLELGKGMPAAQPAEKKAKAQAVQAAVTPAVEQHPMVALSKRAARKLKAAAVARKQERAEAAEESIDQEEQQVAQPNGQQGLRKEQQGLADQLTRAANGAVEPAPVEESGFRSKEKGTVEPVPVEKSGFRSKEKVLLLTSRGIPPRFRHLMLDLIQLLPHSKKDAKLDTKSDRQVINEVADMKGCNNVVFFEARKHKDLYLWMAKAPSGPSVKFHCTNVHTMAELKLSGNHLKGSRPVLSFSKVFDEQPHWQLMKEMLTHVFATPKGHQKSKPFTDHVINFAVADERIWIRNYQVVANLDKKKVTSESISLVEVGPRMTLNPIKVLEGSFAGPVLYSNPAFVSPNLVRAEAKRQMSGKYSAKLATTQKRKTHAEANPLPVSELADVFKEGA